MSIESEPVESSEVEAVGRELGDAISSLPEYEAFLEAQEAVRRSEHAQEKIQAMEDRQREFALARQVGQADESDLEDLRRMQRELHELPVMAEYFEAQEKLDARLSAVNDAISTELAVDFADSAGGCCHD